MSKLSNVSTLTSQINIPTDLVCFSHLRWNFVYQRPQHLLSRFANIYRLFFVEEPVYTDKKDTLEITNTEKNIWIVVPHLSHKHEQEHNIRIRRLLEEMIIEKEINQFIAWYYTPMALKFTFDLKPIFTIYDCMDELSAFKFAPPELKKLEAELLSRADLVFTGGQSLYEAKKHSHSHIYAFPSSIDKEHFTAAREKMQEPLDQINIPHPRLGFYGVVDERMDIGLISKVADQKPNWHFVIVGPVVKIDPQTLPKNPNIHYLGSKTYEQLPAYLSGWDIAIIPFALNESTKYISPTKTPEYLAAGKPVISTSIRDVVHPYKTQKLVHIADEADEFIHAAETELKSSEKSTWLNQVDEFLSDNSWDNTWNKMKQLIENRFAEKQLHTQSKTKEQVYV